MALPSSSSSSDLRRRLLLGLRLAVLAGVLLAAVGLAGHLAGGSDAGGVLGATWLTTTLGPTAYVLLAHPHSVTSRLRNGVVGHTAGIAAGLVSLAVFGLWSAPSVAQAHDEGPARVGAQALALALTLLVLTLAAAHHAPSGATALLVASGIAAPGPPLAGLVIGLVLVLGVAPLLARLPGERDDTAAIDARETPMG